MSEKERKLQKQVNELLAMTKDLSQQRDKLKEERDRWVKFVNIQVICNFESFLFCDSLSVDAL